MSAPEHFPETWDVMTDDVCADGGCEHEDWPTRCPTRYQRTVCGGACVTSDTGDFGTCDRLFSPDWPCRPSRLAQLSVVPS